MSVTHTTYEVYDHPEPIPVPNYPAIAIEELSLKYKALIEAERKHFMTAEHEYNDFIFKMDAIHKELESKLNRQVIENNELRADNTELARKLRELEINFEKKSDTLKKLYTVHQIMARKLEALEQDNAGLRGTADRTTERNVEISSDLKNVLQERNYLDDRIADMQARHTVELNRLNNTVIDRERQILDREREIDRLNADLRRISDDNHRLKMDLDSLRMNYDSTLNQKDMEIQHLRRLLEDQRNQPAMLEPRVPQPIIDNNSNEETIWKLKNNLEEAYRTIENLTRNPKKQVEIIEKPKFIDRIVEKPVERIIRVPVENERERERESYRMGRPGYQEEDSDAGWDDDRREKLLKFAQRMFNKKLAHLYFVIWKLLFHIDHMDRLLKKYRAGGNEQGRTVPMHVSPREHDDLPAFQEGLLGIYHDVRRGIVDYIFEVFVRSANHAHQKKVNSLILFIINIKELKERHVGVFLLLLDSFMRIRMTVKSHIKTKAWAIEAGKSAGKNIDKRKTSDLEFRDMTNSWIQDTLENIKRRRNFDKHDPQNMEYLYLFRLLAIKYRVIYPLRGKPFEVDADLAVKLETKICKAFLRVVEIEDVTNS